MLVVYRPSLVKPLQDKCTHFAGPVLEALEQRLLLSSAVVKVAAPAAVHPNVIVGSLPGQAPVNLVNPVTPGDPTTLDPGTGDSSGSSDGSGDGTVTTDPTSTDPTNTDPTGGDGTILGDGSGDPTATDPGTLDGSTGDGNLLGDSGSTDPTNVTDVVPVEVTVDGGVVDPVALQNGGDGAFPIMYTMAGAAHTPFATSAAPGAAKSVANASAATGSKGPDDAVLALNAHTDAAKVGSASAAPSTLLQSFNTLPGHQQDQDVWA